MSNGTRTRVKQTKIKQYQHEYFCVFVYKNVTLSLKVRRFQFTTIHFLTNILHISLEIIIIFILRFYCTIVMCVCVFVVVCFLMSLDKLRNLSALTTNQSAALFVGYRK